MPIEFGLWRIDGSSYNRLSSSKLDEEGGAKRPVVWYDNLNLEVPVPA